MNLCIVAVAAALLAAPVAAMAQAAAPLPPPPEKVLPPSPGLAPAGDFVATLKASPHFTLFAKALDANGLSAQLKPVSGLTVFAPTDDAFNALPPGQLQFLMSPAGAAQLRKVLSALVIGKSMESGAIKGSKGDVVTIGGTAVALDGGGEAIMVADADVIQADVRASNNVVIYAIDKVPIPAGVTFPASVH